MAGNYDVDIIFDRSTAAFNAGERVTGTIFFTNKDLISLEALNMHVRGEGRNFWVDQASDKIFEGRDVYLDYSVKLLDAPKQFRPGQHRMPFRFSLPVNLPSSFEGEFGHVRYTCQAVANVFRQNAKMSVFVKMISNPVTEITQERSFTVWAQLNLKSYPNAARPVKVTDITSYLCCCFPAGSVLATLDIPRNGFIPKQSILLNGEVRNKSYKKISSVQIALVQRARFFAKSRYESVHDSKELKRAIAVVTKAAIGPRKTLKMKDELLKIPAVVPTFRSRSLEISYALRYVTSSGVDIEIPLTIGTMDTTGDTDY